MKHNFKELKIWQRAKVLCIDVYKLTKEFPGDERFGLTNQLRRCAVSVPSNIAEGCGRNTDKQLIHFLNIAMGSLTELETQVIISHELGYINSEIGKEVNVEINELQKMINVFRIKILKNLESKNLVSKNHVSKI